MSLSKMHFKAHGRIKIQDKSTNEILIEKDNAIHVKNMSTIIARGLTRKPNAFINSIKFGNGGTVPAEGINVTFKSPNIMGNDLYNPIHEEIIESSNPDFETGNYLTFQEDGDLFPVVICIVNISANQPSNQLPAGQLLVDNMSNEFAFDELGLFTNDGKMLSHVIFPPRLKTQGKELLFTYTITIIATDEIES